MIPFEYREALVLWKNWVAQLLQKEGGSAVQ